MKNDINSLIFACSATIKTFLLIFLLVLTVAERQLTNSVRFSLAISLVLSMISVFVSLFLTLFHVKKGKRVSFLILNVSFVWEVVNCVLLSDFVKGHSERIVQVYYLQLVNTITTLVCVFGLVEFKSDVRVKKYSENYLDNCKSEVDLKIEYAEPLSKESITSNCNSASKATAKYATSIARYTARKPDEVSLNQFETVTVISQHKSYALVKKKNNTTGQVPASLLKINNSLYLEK